MEGVIYRASFYLYELSFLTFGVALLFAGLAYRKIIQSLHYPPFWIALMAGAVLLWICAINHFIVYHYLSPQYLANQSQDILILMYVFKTISISCVFLAGLGLLLSFYGYWKKISDFKHY